jgi:hypothetical protein
MARSRVRTLLRGGPRPRRARRLPDGARPPRPLGAPRGARHRPPPRRGLAAGGRRPPARLLALGVPGPAPLPERLIGSDLQAFFDLHVRAGLGLGAVPGCYPREVLDAYRRPLDDRGMVEAMCEDYGAGASNDIEDDDADREAGRQIPCPTLVPWAARGGLPHFYPDVLEVWRPWHPTSAAHRRRRHALPGRGPPGADRLTAADLPRRAVTASRPTHLAAQAAVDHTMAAQCSFRPAASVSQLRPRTPG